MDGDFEGPNNKGVAFALWLACLFGFCGIHRFYLGRTGTGLLYLFTFGLLGIGQLVDLFRLPQMVAEENMRMAALRALAERHMLANRAVALLPAATPEDNPERFRQKLLEAASRRGGKLSVTEGVMATGRTFDEVEKELDAMARSGYVGIDNDPQNGRVVYTFGELGED